MLHLLLNKRVRYAVIAIFLIVTTIESAVHLYTLASYTRERNAYAAQRAVLAKKHARLQKIVDGLKKENPEVVEFVARGLGYVGVNDIVKYV